MIWQESRAYASDGRRNSGAQLRGVIGQAGNERPGATFQKITEIRLDHMPKETFLQISDDPLSDTAHEEGLTIPHHCLDQAENDDGKRDEQQHGAVLVEENLIQSRLHQKSLCRRDR